MKPAPFAYHAPTTKAEVLSLLAGRDDSRVLAGGQSLVPLLNLRLAAPEHLIDLNGVAELDGIAIVGRDLAVGAMTRQRTAERSDLVARCCPLLAAALRHVGHPQTRNRGTIGGSIAHMDPTAELPVVAAAWDAVLTIESEARGRRRIPFAALSAGYLQTGIEGDEILVEIAFPIWPVGHGWGFEEVTRSGEGYATVSVATLVALGPAGAVERIAVAIGGLAAAPIRLATAEAALAGQVPSGDLIAEAGRHARALQADGDPVSPAEYKRHLAGVLTVRALRAAVARALVPSRG